MANRNLQRQRGEHHLPQLPDDVIVEKIFSKLPTKLVGRLRCECRLWNRELSRLQFKKLHLAHNNEVGNIIVVTNDFEFGIISLPFDEETVPYAPEHTCYVVVGSCNGLLLYLDERNNMFLTNPITHDQVSVPTPPPWLNGIGGRRLVCGFGCDTQNNDYKIVAFSFMANDLNVVNVDVFSLNASAWNRMNNFPYIFVVNYFSHGVFLNGYNHWLALRVDNGLNVIVRFDVANGTFSEMNAPGVIRFQCQIFVLDGFLCLKLARPRTTQFWQMSVYGANNNAWIILGIRGEDFVNRTVRPLCSTGDNNICMLVGENNVNVEEKLLILYNVGNRERHQVGEPVRDAVFFRSSLVSPFFNN